MDVREVDSAYIGARQIENMSITAVGFVIAQANCLVYCVLLSFVWEHLFKKSSIIFCLLSVLSNTLGVVRFIHLKTGL